jgi:tetratricopeptide (TPR) repeat protein
VHKRIMAVAWGMLLTLYTAAGQAATAQADGRFDARFLERVDAYTTDGDIEIRVGMTRAFRYISHTLGPRREVLQIQMLHVNNVTAPGDDSKRRRNPDNALGQQILRWTGRSEVPLDEVLAEASGNTGQLILRFSRAVTVKAVRVDTDNRRASVIIAGPKATAEVPAVSPVPEVLPEGQPGSYVLNLVSTRAAQSVDATRAALAVDGRRVYQSVGVVENQKVYRLRLGFFPTQPAAQSVAKQLEAEYPGVWVSQVTAVERRLVEGGETLVDPAQVMIESDVDKTLPPISLQRLTSLMEEARQAVAGGNASRAVLIYNRVIAYPVSPYREDAQELLGVAYEKKGQLAQAKAAYQDYLARYPEGAGASRVRQRLAGLVTAAIRPRERLRRGKEPGEVSELDRWDVFGSVGQYYQRDFNRFNSEEFDTAQSLLSNQLDFNAQRQGDNEDVEVRFTGSYDHDFLDSADSQVLLSSAYVDYASRNQVNVARLGRQTRSSGGVLGRFDGLGYGYKFAEDYRLNLVAGAPVERTEDGWNTHQRFYGASVDAGPLWDDWSFNLYGIQQDVDGITDRTAVGGEVRYFTTGRSLFGLVDYDVYFDELNIFYAIGNWSITDRTTLNMVVDYRMSPLLTTSNALIAQSVTTIDALKMTLTEAQIKRLARARTATSRSLTGGANYILDSHWQVNGDLTLTKLSSLPATTLADDVDAIPGSGLDYYYNLQVVGADLAKDGDLAIVGLRYSDATAGQILDDPTSTDPADVIYADSASQTLSTLLNYRYPVDSSWRVNPLLRVDYRWESDGTDQWTFAPVLRSTYVWKRKLTIDFEGGAQVIDQELSDGTRDLTEIYYVYFGYRYDF